MKLLLVLLAVVAGVLLWRSKGTTKVGLRPQRPEHKGAKTDEMLSCAHCALHIPASEAFAGKRGSYCSVEHRRLAES